MSKVMKTTTLSALLARMAGEYRAKDSIFEIPGSIFRHLFALEAESPGLVVMSGRASLPVGPAAGPHTQIAPNIVAAYLAGARVFELKTVQKNDRLDIGKPCIDALDEGHNVEWSTELSLEEARREYLNGWIATNLLANLFSRKPNDFIFNMSVGYTLEGIQSETMDAFIEGMRRPEATPLWDHAMEELEEFLSGDLASSAFGGSSVERAKTFAAHVPVRPVHSVTLSTMHGCPPDEIGRIGAYLLAEKGFDTFIKLNPTLLGFDKARSILNQLGWEHIVLSRENFEHDLQYPDALSLVSALGATAQEKGRRFGIKLSNTLANANDSGRLPGAERYMSGRALFPLTIHLAARLARSLDGYDARFSYCGGVSALNAADLVKAGMGPLTVATDILKPGGYARLAQIAREATSALQYAPERADPEALEALAAASLERPEYRFGWKEGTVSIAGKLPLHDCFAAPCVHACPVNQKVPSYVKALGEGKAEQALATVLSDNPLAHITGILCDHVCQEHCSRIDYEGPVRIRDMKHIAASEASLPAHPRPTSREAKPGRTAVIGAGPAGLACAHYLALAGFPVTVFDARQAPGGVPATVIPGFRIGRAQIAADINRIQSLGVEFEFGHRVESLAELEEKGFDSFFLGIGAEEAKSITLKGSPLQVIDALAFLDRYSKEEKSAFPGVKHIVVAGGGNTACDAVRVATRLEGVESVRLSYRRRRADMPADLEELENAISEAKSLGEGNSPLLELTLPESADPGFLVLRNMKPGEKDSSGRRAPVPSGETTRIPCDLLVAAIGESPDTKTLEAFGIGRGADGRPAADPETMETPVKGLYVGGDARRGPSSIISAEADGRRAARAILRDHGIETPETDYRAPAIDFGKLAARGEMLPSLELSDPGFALREAERCLACDSACLRCIEVCPNRANFMLSGVEPFAQGAQILHIDRFCNECGNCGFFCPWEGEPFTGKPTFFDTMEDLEASKNAGFAFILESGPPALALRQLPAGAVSVLDYASWNGADSLEAHRSMIALAREVFRRHEYLLEEIR